MESSRSPALIALAVALPVALIVGVIVAAVLANRIPAHAPVGLAPVPAPEAGGADCAALLAALPSELGGGENGSGEHGNYEQAELADPAPLATRAWSGEAADDLVVLRCGLDRPIGFDVASPLTVVNGVQWFQVSGADQGLEASTWFAVDRAVYVALTVPDGSGPTPVQVVSDTIAATLPAQPLDPAPLPN